MKSSLKIYIREPKAIFSLLMIAVLAYSCTGIEDINEEQNGIMLFNSGFEPGSEIFHRGDPLTADDKIIGKDLSVSPPNDWVEDIDNSDNLGTFSLQYQGADTTKRIARIINEPANPENHVLHFRINEPWVNHRGSRLARIQANIYDEDPNSSVEPIKELYQRVRLFLHEDMEVVKRYPNRINWLTIFEVWNNKTWDNTPYPFRITVGMGKPTGDTQELSFMVDAEDFYHRSDTSSKRGYDRIWHEMNTEIPIPIGSWMTLEYYVKEGNNEEGRFYMAMTPEGGERKVIFDIIGFTHITHDPAPSGISLWNPMKLYTSTELTNFVREQGKSLQVYWDDIEVWKNRRPSLIQ